jgi:glycosyltransferase involved in cell wall biosynthesis
MALPLSVYFRTHNEAHRIARSIAAVRSLTDDVVVVDDGSSDQTVEIARSAGARVILQPWLGNGHQKRLAEDHCVHDFLLDLDADEVISESLQDEIVALWSCGPPKFSVYKVPAIIVNPVTDLPANYTRVYHCRLYDRRVVRAPAHTVWDQFQVPRGIKVGTLKGVIIHHTYRTFDDLSAKLNRVSTRRVETVRDRSRLGVAIRVLFGMPFYFAKHLLQRRLIRGGVYGIALARIHAHARWQRDAKAYERLLMERRDSVRSVALEDEDRRTHA